MELDFIKARPLLLLPASPPPFFFPPFHLFHPTALCIFTQLFGQCCLQPGIRLISILFSFALLLFLWLPDDFFDIQSCKSISSNCTCTVTLVPSPLVLYFLPFLPPVLLLLFFFSPLHTCRGQQAGRCRQAGCHGNRKQVAAGVERGD